MIMNTRRHSFVLRYSVIAVVVVALAMLSVYYCGAMRVAPQQQGDGFPYLLYEDFDAGDSVVLDGDPRYAAHIVISKERQTLTLYDTKWRAVRSIPVAVGANYGNKQISGDLKTPEGEFIIESIHDASTWGQDSGNENGYIQSCYGNWFLRLRTPPYYGIGIHATIRPHTIGTRATEGCTTMNTDSLDRLRPLVREGMPVTIETSLRDMAADGRCVIVYRNSLDEFSAYGTDRYCYDIVGEVVQDTVDHRVVLGDTHLSLAVKYGTTRRCIEALNPGVDLSRLTPGQVVRVRGSFEIVVKRQHSSRFAKDEATDTAYYVATSVDTFGRIAVMHRSSTKRIQELNPDIAPEQLVPGMRIRVR